MVGGCKRVEFCVIQLGLGRLKIQKPPLEAKRYKLNGKKTMLKQ